MTASILTTIPLSILEMDSSPTGAPRLGAMLGWALAIGFTAFLVHPMITISQTYWHWAVRLGIVGLYIVFVVYALISYWGIYTGAEGAVSTTVTGLQFAVFIFVMTFGYRFSRKTFA